MAPRIKHTDDVHAAAAALGQRGGVASAKALTKAERVERARHAGKHGGWPKGRKRGPRKAKTS